MNKILAKNKKGISTAAIDFFSFGHLLGGYFAFIILNAIYLVIFGFFTIEMGILTAFLCGVIWEIVENTFLLRKNIKFGYRKDSILNSLSDIGMLTLGGYIASIFLEFDLEFFLIASALFYISTVILMSIYAHLIINLFRRTNNKKKK